MRKVLIIGATSAIAEAVARRFAARGDALYLIGRDSGRTQAIADDLVVRGAARVGCVAMDLIDFAAHSAALDQADQFLDGIDTVLIAHGTLSDQSLCQTSVDALRCEFEINTLSTLSLLTLLGNRCEQRRNGTIAVISSVAGDRGRQSNYVYGAAKATISTFLEGMRQRLAKSNVHVLTIKPGFVDTPMTAHIESKGPLWAKPDYVAKGIVRAIDRNRNVVYLPWFWDLIMFVIKHIPEPIFKRLKL